MAREIQYDLFPASAELSVNAETFSIMRPHKWAHGEACELPLVSIELAPHEGRWMWATTLNSHNGSGQGSRAMPKWNRFAASKAKALLHGADDVLKFMHRATPLEQQRIASWLEEVASLAVSSGQLHPSPTASS